MKKTNNGLEIVKEAQSNVRGSKVLLTRKTTLSGNVRHGVVLEDRRGWHKLVGSYLGIAPAWKVFKALAQ